MPELNPDLLSIDRGLVTSPAGCGKTHLISVSVKNHQETKPILVLTHTNAGVAALRQRFHKAGVSSKCYRLSTLDGFAMRLVGSFPFRSEVNPDILKLENPSQDYTDIKNAACHLLSQGHIQDILFASYARLIVDEYQDCCIQQHRLVALMASVLPTCILGDPMQAVFGWLGLPNWTADVCAKFPVVAELNIPWRWRNAGTEEFGLWLLDVRKKLLDGEPIDFKDSPNEVTWVDLEAADNCHVCQLSAARIRAPSSEGSVLIIGSGLNPPAQRKFASQVPGTVTIENVSLEDFIDFAKCFDCSSPEALNQLIDFYSKVMRNVNRQRFLKRVSSLEMGRARNPASEAENAALRFKAEQSPATAVDLLVALNKDASVTCYRPLVLRACIKSLNACSCTDGNSLYKAAICVREQNRLLGRSLPKRAVGSTLLLKGLEAEVSVILNAADHDENSLYVAMTRGSHRLTVCSHSSVWDR
ncbi:conserved hypothetical protein [Desulfatibacillum aliphaticivorans]|uniref:DNA 3'-5' helicase II n=1 Tax=Desulfatibacillum aliphaticivorans TaxID=218208 RepID=B8FD17_DESAL|nr:UvrD-helicase domain-containing protein [Desulfatibacillum aliphaticivorans]ACL06448.1 conserved hypothetical protein [Desulfatibacillum aliphaticivorans]